MNIVIGQWYRFDDEVDKKIWLDTVYSRLFEPVEPRKFYEPRELLRVILIGDELHMRHRTEWNDLAIMDVETYQREPGSNCAIVNYAGAYLQFGRDTNGNITVVGYHNTGKAADSIIIDDLFNTNKNGEVNNMNLISNARRNEQDICSDNFKKVRDEFLKGTIAGKAIFTAADIINEQILKDTNYSVDWSSLLTSNLMTKDEYDQLSVVEYSFNDEMKAIDAKYDELIELYNITDTYEQKEALLRKYCVLKY